MEIEETQIESFHGENQFMSAPASPTAVQDLPFAQNSPYIIVNEEGRDVFRVYLNVYDTNAVLNRFLSCLGFGFYISCVQVHGQEHLFRANDGIVSGVQRQMPWCQNLNLRDSILMGTTDLKADEFLGKLKAYSSSFSGKSYDRITRNCHHFSNFICKELTGDEIPPWVNRVAKIGRRFVRN